MGVIRSERLAAFFLLVAAGLGVIAANSPVGPALMDLHAAHLRVPGTVLDLSVEQWISDGLLAIFFFVVAVELKNEFVVGQLNSVSRAIRPAIAALGGVIVPAVLYVVVTSGTEFAHGWPIPTATDIAFALGVLAVFGSAIPSRLRIFVLALAIFDDIVAIAIVAVFFTSDPHIVYMACGAAGVVAFGLLSKLLHTRFRLLVAVVMIMVALVTCAFVYLSGVHATIAGVALGLAMARVPALHARHALEPVTNGMILPVFAFSAALVTIPDVALTELAAPFWGILIALPIGKILGIGMGGWLSGFIGRGERRPHLTVHGLVTAGALGGIGFTVSLLMNELAFSAQPEISRQGTLAVLIGSSTSIVIAAILTSRLAARYKHAPSEHHTTAS